MTSTGTWAASAPICMPEGPRTLIHNDYHAENLFFAATGDARSIAVTDWQVATLGRGVIDIARFLGGNLHPGRQAGP